jgi:hypothetical protein
MEKVVWSKALIDLIEILYPKTLPKGGRPPYLLVTMLRIHLRQQWYDLGDPAMEDALIEVPMTRRLAGIDMISDLIGMRSGFLRSGTCWRSMISVSRSLRWSKPTSRPTAWP